MANLIATGYVHNLLDNNLNFSQFMLGCARAFGALIDMRDEPLSAPIPNHFEVSDYCTKRLAEAQENLKRSKRLSYKQREARGRRLKKEEISRLTKSLAQEQANLTKIKEMLSRVSKWNPPTSAHQELKTFAIDQLESTVRHTMGNYFQEALHRATYEDPYVFFVDSLEAQKKNVAYYEKEIVAEKERVKNRNKWLKELRESL